MNRKHEAPGKSHRQGISLMELFEMFPDNSAAEKWFEISRWGGAITCPRCDSPKVSIRKNRKPMPFHCRSCRKYFSVKTGTPMARSKIPLQKWAIGIFLYTTNLKGISSMKLHRDLKITQRSAWYMLHRIRESFAVEEELLSGTVEVDETFVGGLEKTEEEIALIDKELDTQCESDLYFRKINVVHGASRTILLFNSRCISKFWYA